VGRGKGTLALARSIGKCIEISTVLEIEDIQG
jgi:hypothetical protein